MGRRNHTTNAPQRSRLVANRELRMALKAPRPIPFGIRRALDYNSQLPILECFGELSRDGEIPEPVFPRLNLHTTLLPLRELDGQLTRGLVVGYEFGRGMAHVENNIKEEHARQLAVSLGGAAIIKNKYVALLIESEQLDAEHEKIRMTMARLGLKGALKFSEPLHITLGDTTETLSRFEKKHIVDVLNESMPMEESVVLDPIEFYSRDYYGRH